MLERLRKLAIDLVVVVSVGLVAYSILGEVWSSGYSITVADVPKQAAEAFQDEDGVASSLRAEIGSLLKDAQTDVAVRPTIPELSAPDLNVAGTAVPLRA